MPYLIPARDDFAGQRADLSLGLRSATRYYNELVVPGIGEASLVRHLSWAVASIRLRERSGFNGKAVTVAHSLEALGNKLEWWSTAEEDRRSLRVPGKNAFRRNPDAWDFSQLSQRRFYVQVTQRQVTTRALPAESGLGLTEGSTRYNGMSLGPMGIALADAMLLQDGFGSGTPRLGANLQEWIRGRFSVDGDSRKARLRNRIGPNGPTRAEQDLVLGRLASTLSPRTDLGKRDPNRRTRLLSFLDEHVGGDATWSDTASLLRWLSAPARGGAAHARDLQTALDFEDMRAAAILVVASLVAVLAGVGSKVSVQTCGRTEPVRVAVGRLRVAAARFRTAAEEGRNGHHDAVQFAAESCGEVAEVIMALVRRDDRILTLAGETIWRGAAWRPDVRGVSGSEQADGLDEAPISGRPRRLFQFIGLWRDCRGQR